MEDIKRMLTGNIKRNEIPKERDLSPVETPLVILCLKCLTEITKEDGYTFCSSCETSNMVIK